MIAHNSTEQGATNRIFTAGVRQKEPGVELISVSKQHADLTTVGRSVISLPYGPVPCGKMYACFPWSGGSAGFLADTVPRVKRCHED